MDFVSTLLEMRRGAALNECGEELARLVRKVRSVGKKGKFVLEIAVMPGQVNKV